MKSLRIKYLQHVPFEGPAYIARWADQHGHSISPVKLYSSDNLPAHNTYDWLVIMGGPMGVYDEDKYAWMKAEKTFIREAIQQGKTILGICLGAQLLAEVLGAKVYPNPKKEIGFFPVSLSDQGKNHLLLNDFPQSANVFHWHGDTFDLPQGATHLLSSEVCMNQAFVYDDRVVGLQFHLETTPESIAGLIENCRNELVPDDYIQSEEEIVQKTGLCTQTNELLVRLLDNLAE